MLCRGKLVWALALGCGLLYAKVARAVEIRDGGDFSVSIGVGRPVCIVFPPALFDPLACRPGTKPVEHNSGDEDSQWLGVGALTLDDHDPPDRGTLTVVRTKVRNQIEPSDSVVKAFARGMAGQMLKAPGAKMVGEMQTKLIDVSGVRVARITFDTDGAFERGPTHVVNHVAWSDKATYTVTMMGAAGSAAAVDAAAAAAAATMRVAHPPHGKAYRLAIMAGRFLGGMLGAAFVLGVVLMVVLTRRERKSGAGHA